MNRWVFSKHAVVTLALLTAPPAPAAAQAPPEGPAEPAARPEAPAEEATPEGPAGEAAPARPAGPATGAGAGAGAGAKAAAEMQRFFDEGVKASSQGRWEQARQAFLEAWKRKPHYQVAAHLGRAEVTVGKPKEAVEHLTYFLREAPGSVRREDRQQAQALLDTARAQVGTVVLRVEPAGAEVLVDGERLEGAEAGGEVTVNPGRRVIEARREGYEPAEREVDVAAGGRVEVRLRLERERPPALPPPPVPEGDGRSIAVIGVGIGAAVAAAGAGVVLVVLGMGKAQEQEDLQGADGKFPEDPVVAEDWRHLKQSREDLLNAGTWSLIGAGVLGAATTVYALTGRAPAPEPQKAGQIRVYPTGMGIALSGRW